MKMIFLMLLTAGSSLLITAQNQVDFSTLTTEALENAIAANACTEKYSKEWEEISSDNVVWNHRIWRRLEIDDNPLLDTDALPLTLGAVLYGGVKNGSIVAFDPVNDRFTTLMSLTEVLEMADLDWTAVRSFAIKEDYMFLKEEQQLLTRIIGIAPIIDGKPVFWLYYPNIRSFLYQYPIRTSDERMDNVDKFFECHGYAASIDKRL